MSISGVQISNSLSRLYSTLKSHSAQKTTDSITTTSPSTDSVSISDAAKILAARETSPSSRSSGTTSEIQKQLEAIKAKPGVNRTPEDMDFLQKNDSRWVEISGKSFEERTADEIDYMQKAGGFVNTMAYLSPKEKQLYDEMIASGNPEAAEGMNQIALSRTADGNFDVTTPGGRTFNPKTTEITADNVRNLFKYTVVDSSGNSDRRFDALANFLENRESSKA